MGFIPPAVSRRIPRLFQRATQPPYLRAGDLWSHTDGSGVDYYDGTRTIRLAFDAPLGPVYEVEAYHYGLATWADAVRDAAAVARANGGGRVVFPPGMEMDVDQVGHACLYEHPADGNGAWTPPTIKPITLDLNGSKIKLGANTLRFADAPTGIGVDHTTDYNWVRYLEICNGWIDANNIPGTSVNHILFGNCKAGFIGRQNYEYLYFHDLRGINGYTNQSGTSPVRWWLGIIPVCLLNDDVNLMLVRDVLAERCTSLGGQTGVVLGSSYTGGTITFPTDHVNHEIHRAYLDRFYHDTGWIPTQFVSGGNQLGGYSLLKDSVVRRSVFKGAGDAGLETDNCHNVLVEDTVIENAWNSEYLVSSFGANDTDQGGQNIVYNRCVARHKGGSPTQLGGFLAYTIRGHRLGSLAYDRCKYESDSIPLHPGTGIDALALKAFADTLTAIPVNNGDGTYTIALAKAVDLVVGYEVQIGGATNGEWTTVQSIVDSTHAKVGVLANAHAIGASVTQPCPVERVEVDIDSRVQGAVYSDPLGGSYYGFFATVQQCLLQIRKYRARLSATTAGPVLTTTITHVDATHATLGAPWPRASGTTSLKIHGAPDRTVLDAVVTNGSTAITSATAAFAVGDDGHAADLGFAGALIYYAGQISGRAIELDLEGFDPKADVTFGGTQGSYYGLILGVVNGIRPSTIWGVIKRLVPRPGTGYPAANQTGLYLMDGTGLVIDPRILRVKDSDFSNLNAAAKPVTWQRAGENVLPVVLEESNVYANRALVPRTIRLIEHFIGGLNSTGLIGEDGWNTNNSVSGGIISHAAATVGAGHPGVYQLDTGTTAGGNLFALGRGTTGNPAFNLDEWFDETLVFQLAQVDANTVMRVGISENSVLNPPLYGYWLRLVAGGTNFEFVVSNGGGSNLSAVNGPAPDTNWHMLRIRRYSVNGGTVTVGMSLDGGAETTFTAAGAVALPTAHAVNDFYQIGNNGTNASKKLYADMVDLAFPNLLPLA